ncbi:TOG array regulator of axonemal microtubules protein 1-like isoform X2 [Physella acuta]|uniref:TOG array regulator of axonemal microtubules protein 1-like isoform X2 n=1 Tax=Physella acuta TaxID=109671 RepID=UPI0027DE54B6|nr:TOG array regulator of axonemal microtubules protein 1-like isoform X2 [Physella acuta]
MASKVQVATFPQQHDFNVDGHIVDPIYSRWNMEEDDVAGQLKDDSFKKRVEVLEQLIITVKRNGGRLPYADGESIFRSLGLALSDSNWEIRNKCIQLLQEIIPNLGDEIDRYMSLVLNKLVTNIGDSKVTVRRMVVQALHAYMKYTHNLPSIFEALVNFGLENENPAVRREMVTSLPMLLTQEFLTQDLSKIITSLAKKLLDTSPEGNLKESSLLTLNQIEQLVDEKVFAEYLKKLSMPLQNYYLQLSGKHSSYNDIDGDYHHNLMYQGIGNMRNDSRRGYVEESVEFGVVPSHVLSRINDQKDFRTRAQAVEELNNIIKNKTNHEISTSLMPHMNPFLSFLSNLLDDSNFKITHVTLEIIQNLVEKMDKSINNFLKPLKSALLKRMGDNKTVIRQLVMTIVIKMMRTASPQAVINVIEDNLQHKNSRVRQETINFIIAALLTFPSYEFDLSAICYIVGPTLTDVKRAVRQAALECFATLAQGMGSGQLQPLVSAVDQVELSSDGEGLMAAVQARLARKQLPKLTQDGLVEYATQTPSSATVRSSSAQQSADTEWIMAVGAGSVSNTARTARSDSMEVESVNVSARSTPMASETSAPTSAPRRFMSAGRGRNKLPWEEDRDERIAPYNNLPNAAFNQVSRVVKSARAVSFTVEDVPPKPRQTWIGDGDMQQKQNIQERHSPKRRTTVMVLNPSDDTDNGSYSQLYQQKLRRQQNFSVRTSRSDDIRENGYNRQDQRSARSQLDPISVDVDDPNDSSSYYGFKPDEDDTPIPRKATIARGSAGRRKVPPISMSSDFDDSDSAYVASDDSKSSMNGSLKTIRSSATKKRADKLFEKLEKQNSERSLKINSHQLEEHENKKSKKPETKPAHTSNNNNRGRRNTEETDDNKGSVGHLDYNPTSGVTFRENKTADVQVVGKGYADETSEAKVVPPAASTSRIKEKRKLMINRGALLTSSPFGLTSMHLPGSIEPESDEKYVQGPGISLVGRGMFDTSVSADHTPAAAPDVRMERRKTEVKAAPSGVVGVAVRSTVDISNYSSETSSLDDDMDDENSLSLTQSLKEKLAIKQQQRLEEDERRRVEKESKEREKEERREREKEEKLKKERERQQEKLKRLSSAESIHSFEFLSVSGSASGSGSSINSSPSVTPSNTSATSPSITTKPASIPPPKPQAPAVTPRKVIKTSNELVSTFPMPVTSSLAPFEGDNPADWKPFKDSEAAYRELMKKLEQDDWETKCEGINMLRRLCVHHPDTVLASLHPLVIAICKEITNLRSQVSRLAITTVGEMFLYLKKGMDTEVELTTKTLLIKGGESNQFIREDVDKALCCLVDNTTPQRALQGIVLGGASHKNPQVRKTSAQFLVELVEKMGSGRILSGVKDITDKVLPTAAHFSLDGSPETRYYGRKILHMLMAHQDFERMLPKYLPANTLRNVQEVVENLKQRGLGERPSELSSARSRKSGHGSSRSNSTVRGGSASSSADSGVIGLQTQRKALVRTDEARMEEVKAMLGQLSANNWQERYDGVTEFQKMCETYSAVVSSQIIKIFDKFLPRLTDSNSKVNLYALKVLLEVIPLIRESMSSVISMTVAAVAPNLSSKNKDINTTAVEILDSLIENIDLPLLIQPFANQALNATARSKADMVDKVSYLVGKVYPRKQKPVVLHVLPLVWHLLGSMNASGATVHGGSNDLRRATGTLISTLYDCMGQGLIEKASAEPSNTQRQIQTLQSLIDNS